ncbi:MAG: hypothetical protein AUH86_01530 [Acidobacteria bacterium 13_1_40CM_4_58_4]|nr:MAG: hypothetical protein AUH86_01530 [Acidobacteria bacterium 13_1_40CM_4_58_4]
MRFRVCIALLSLGVAQFSWEQTNASSKPEIAEKAALGPPDTLAVIGATADQEASLRSQIQVMHPEVLPLRILFVPHWKYLDAARAFQLHVPTGFGSLMFTHLPSRTVYIDNDRYMGTEWLGHWMAHELGHLASNSAKEEDAERAAREFRKRLKQSLLAKSR